jgi:hypothetical protein
MVVERNSIWVLVCLFASACSDTGTVLGPAGGTSNAGGSSGNGSGGASPGGTSGQTGGAAGSESGGSGGGSAGSGNPSGGTAGAATTCDSTLPFGTPAAVPGLDSAELEGGARFTSDELTVIFDRGDETHADLFIAHRATRTDPVGPGEPLALDGSPESEVRPWISDDQLTILFDRVSNPTLGPSDGDWTPRIATREFAGSPFLPEAEQSFGVAGDGSAYPMVDATGTGTIYSRGGGILQQPIVNWDPTGTEMLVADRYRPVLTRDELTLYSGQGVYISQRASRDVPFGEPVRLFDGDSPTWISPDGCRLYFEHMGDIYLAERGR